MGINFPAPTAVGQTFSPFGGPSYWWDGSFWRRADLTALPRNRIVNGSMLVSQINGGAYVITNGNYPADQWVINFTGWPNVASIRLATTSPLFAPYYISMGIVQRASLAAGEYAMWQQIIEGYRIADLQWGTVNARPIVVRFTCNCAPAGNYALAIRNVPVTRSYVVPFTAGPSEQEYIFAIPGDTAGTWAKDSAYGLTISFCPATGTTYQTAFPNNWVAGNFLGYTGMTNITAIGDGTFNIGRIGLYLDPAGTGVPPPWEQLDYATTFRECQRHYELVPATVIPSGYTPWPYFGWGYQVSKRITPALSFKSGTPLGALLYTQALETTWGCRHGPATSYADVLIAADCR